TTLKFPSDWDD
nr:Chain B, Inhibitor FR901451 [Flexibacter sp.]